MAKKHWIYIKRGLSEDPKHRNRMGECIWLYLHIVDRADWETGIVYDWKDFDEAADMAAKPNTVRDWRQKLAELGYISCRQKQHGLEITIHNWINPRDYGSKVLNTPKYGQADTREGDAETEPLEAQGSPQGSPQGSSRDGTPTYYSESEPERGTLTHNFSDMTVQQAYKIPTLKMYREATGFMPSSAIWEMVDHVIREGNLTLEQIKAANVAWISRGFKRENVAGILEWAKNGIPENGRPGAAPEQARPHPEHNIFRAGDQPEPKYVPMPDAVREKIGKLAKKMSVSEEKK